MEELIKLGERISSIGFPVLMVVILIGSYYEVWVWGRQLRKCDSDWKARFDELKLEYQDLKGWTGRVTNLAETSVEKIPQQRSGRG
jgi:hypothetical protein